MNDKYARNNQVVYSIASLWLAVMCDIDIADNARREADGAVSR
ncbi:hypothetical protein BN1183_CV_00750 [Pantoea ananatis]|nr:hypothetical protein BN1183_CV_00750 [Pantoea ananatis]